MSSDLAVGRQWWAPPDGPPLMIETEVTEWLRVEQDAVQRWAREGRIPAIKTPGGSWRFHRDELAAVVGATVMNRGELDELFAKLKEALR